MEDNFAIILENISKKYRLYNNKTDRLREALHPLKKKLHKDFYAVSNLNLKVKKGEILGIVGLNGSGKSTMLKMISNVIQPTSGIITTRGKLVPLLELGGGFNPEYTGIENIYFYSSMIGISRREMKKRLQSIIDFADIGDFIYQPIKSYSSGMKARLAFAVSVNIEPDILILDEVLSVGDELFRRKSFAKMEEFFKSGKTILFVSHSIQSVIQLCTRAILIDNGKLLLDGSPKFVGMAYQKYIFADQTNKARIKKEIIDLGKGNNKNSIEVNPVEKNVANDKFGFNSDTESDLKPYYLPDFKPKSTMNYDYFDVKINNSYIKTITGETVNVLVQNQYYLYSFNVLFGINALKVKIGTSFKTEKGQIISGSKYPQGDRYIEKISKGQKFRVDIKFKCTFLPANYYITTGIKGLVNNNREFLNRIDDILVFKVQKEPNIKHWGLVNIGQKINVIEIT